MTDDAPDQIRQYGAWLAGTGIERFELSGPQTSIRLERQGDAYVVPPTGDAEPGAAPAAAGTTTVVRAGSVGVLLLAHPLRQAPLVQVGDAVRAGQALAVLQVGVVLLTVAAPRDGVVTKILAAHGSTVGYGEPLVELD